MNAIQLEFNIDNENEEELKISLIQKQINEMNTSFSKVRKKLFAELSELKRQCLDLKRENQELKEKLLGVDKTEFDYDQADCLFEVK